MDDDWKDMTIRQPVQIAFESERWMLMDDMESGKLSEDISIFLNKYTIPLLDELKDINDYIELYEKKDKRLIMDDKLHIFIVSAYILQGNFAKA